MSQIYSSPDLKTHLVTRLAYSIPIEPLFVCVFVHTFKHAYLRNQRADRHQILSEASWGWRMASLGFGPDRIRTRLHGN